MSDNNAGLDGLISQFLEHLEVERGLSPLTIRNYDYWLRRFSQWIGRSGKNATVGDITTHTIRRFRMWLARQSGRKAADMSLSTQGYHMIAMRSFLKWCSREDIEAMSPQKIDIPKSKDRSLLFLDLPEIQRLLASPAGNERLMVRDRAILELLFSTGLRVSELVALRRDRVDLVHREFSVVGKGGRSRIVFLSDRAVASLKQYLQQRRDHYAPLFIRLGGKKPQVTTPDNQVRLSCRSVQRLVEKYRKQAGISTKITPHGIRHTFATDLLRGGADLREVQELLGHKSVTTTQIYTHVTNRRLRDVHHRAHSGNK